MRFYDEVGKKYLYSGKMAVAPSIECDTITIPLSRGQSQITLPRLLSSRWQADNGKVAYIVVNPEDKELWKLGTFDDSTGEVVGKLEYMTNAVEQTVRTKPNPTKRR